MKRILCLIDTIGFGGGAERQMGGLAGFLYARGYDITLATYHKHDYNPVLKKKYGIESIIIDCGDSSWSKLISVKSFIKKGNFDLVIAFKGNTNRLACMVRMLGVKFKLIVSDRTTIQSIGSKEKMSSFLYRWADMVVANSYTQGNILKGNFPNLVNKIQVITNFTDIEEFKPIENVGLSTQTIRILSVGRITCAKNIVRFMNVVKRLKDEKVPVVFDWYGAKFAINNVYINRVKLRYEELGISDILHFMKATQNIAKAYQACDVFCLPSLYEGYPNAICEAMSCGKPVLCSNVCDNSRIVKDGISGLLFDPKNEEDMYLKIKMMCDYSLMERNRMGDQGRKIAEEKFSKTVFTDKYIKLIESL